MKTLSLFFRLAGHHWKEAIRSSYWQKTVLINIILGIFLLYFLINLIVLGFFLGKILVSAFPGTDPVAALSGILLYYFIADFLLRFFMQPAPVISVVPYLHLPVRKNSIFHFLLIKSGFSLFNFFPVVVLLPFTLRYVIPFCTLGSGLAWIFTLILLIFSSNYLAFFIKKLFSIKPAVLIALAAVTAIVAWVDASHDRVIALHFGDGLMYVEIGRAHV